LLAHSVLKHEASLGIRVTFLFFLQEHR
jgi:hypothetical protein